MLSTIARPEQGHFFLAEFGGAAGEACIIDLDSELHLSTVFKMQGAIAPGDGITFDSQTGNLELEGLESFLRLLSGRPALGFDSCSPMPDRPPDSPATNA